MKRFVVVADRVDIFTKVRDFESVCVVSKKDAVVVASVIAKAMEVLYVYVREYDEKGELIHTYAYSKWTNNLIEIEPF